MKKYYLYTSITYILTLLVFCNTSFAQLPYLVKDINTVADITNYNREVLQIGSIIYYVAGDVDHGIELFKSSQRISSQ